VKHSRLAALVFLALSGAFACRAPEPHAQVVASNDIAHRNAACGDCHADIAREWSQSLHKHAHDDPSYVAALAREPTARDFCERCHAPEGRTKEAFEIGVACTTCHPTTHSPPPTSTSTSTSTSTCSPCHEFTFPDRTSSPLLSDRMQLTMTEHARSDFAATSCTACHMPRTAEKPHASHVFAASRDRDVLSRALTVAARRTSARSIEIVLSPSGVGHAFPTGDLFRRLVVGIERTNAHGERIDFERRVIGREFAIEHGRQVQRADTRPGAPEHRDARVSFVLSSVPEEEGAPVRWFVEYQRVADVRGDAASVEESIIVAKGTVQ
jgi:hypothetical protein